MYFICIYVIYIGLPLWGIVSINLAQSGAHNSERATPMLGLCHGAFADQFIFRHILGHLFPQKQNLHHTYERIGSTRYQKGIKVSFLGLRVFLTGLCPGTIKTCFTPPPLKNCHITPLPRHNANGRPFSVPKVAVVEKFDCIIIIIITIIIIIIIIIITIIIIIIIN